MAANSKKSWAPNSYPIRDARNPQQEIGKIINPPRANKLGGVSEMAFWDPEAGQKGTKGPSGKGPVSDRGKGGRK